MQRYGSEDVRGATIPFSAPAGWKGPPRRAKAEVRAIGNGVTVSCQNCPYTATVAVVLRLGLRFRCSQCGAHGTLAKKIT
jgi:hypothetical protein